MTTKSDVEVEEATPMTMPGRRTEAPETSDWQPAAPRGRRGGRWPQQLDASALGDGPQLLNGALLVENARLKRRIEALEAQLARLQDLKERQAVPNSGVFYVIQLDPEHAPGRIKLGRARDPHRRLASHRCAAPSARFLTFWPCHQKDEGVTIARLTRSGCRRVSREVFDVDDLDAFSRQWLRTRRRLEWPLRTGVRKPRRRAGMPEGVSGERRRPVLEPDALGVES
jgi:hypothetical protein